MRPDVLRKPVIHVAVNILTAGDGRVLLAERTARQVAAGCWELPGGKIDAGETAAQAAARELEEEIGIRALSMQPWGNYSHDFRTQRVHLQFFRVQSWAGQPHGREGQRIAWVDPAAPQLAPILPSNERILRALGLPTACGVMRAVAGGGALASFAQVEQALAGGLRLLQLRAGGMAPDQRVALASRAAAIARRQGAHVLLVGSALEAQRAGASGIHSSAQELWRLCARPAVRLWTASCHDDADLARAAALGADAAVASPVLASAAHPGRAPFGWDGLRKLVAAAPFPVYAQGGMTPAHAARAAAAGARGIAMDIGT
jgi:8-oxo-dGTP diphosphatase